MKGVPDNIAARKCKFRNMCHECGLDTFHVIGYIGQDFVTFNHYRGEADRKLIETGLREVVEGMDQIDADVWSEAEDD